MIQSLLRVARVVETTPNIFVLSLHAPDLSRQVQPGQFINIKVSDYQLPLLRRPFSVYHVADGEISIIFNIIGLGTSMLARKRPGEFLDVIGPLGCSFDLASRFETAVLVAGGLGVAPLPLITTSLRNTSKSIATFLGARRADQIVTNHLTNVRVATDDGTQGFHGTVVELLRSELGSLPSPKIFACGPTPMLRALAALAGEFDIPCEVSLESVMACGIGICQGCPVEMAGGEKKYALICKEGTVFEARSIVFS